MLHTDSKSPFMKKFQSNIIRWIGIFPEWFICMLAMLLCLFVVVGMFSFSTHAATTTSQSTKPDLLNALAALNAATPAPTIPALAPYQKPAVIYFALKGCIHCQKLSPVWSAAVSPMRMQHPHVTFSKLEVKAADTHTHTHTCAPLFSLSLFVHLSLIQYIRSLHVHKFITTKWVLWWILNVLTIKQKKSMCDCRFLSPSYPFSPSLWVFRSHITQVHTCFIFICMR